MKYLPDTDTLIDCILGTGSTRQRIQEFIERNDEVALCPVTIAVLYSGLSEKRRVKWESWLLSLSYWHMGFDVAAQADMYRKTASEAGRTLSVLNSLLAALARDKGAILLTSNIKDYPMKDIRVLSLREEAA